MIIIPRIERDVEINAPIKKVFEILNDTELGLKWNLSVKEISKIQEGKFNIKSTVGDFTTIRNETIENEKLSVKIEGGIFTGMGYILTPKGDNVEVQLWGEFEDEKSEKILTKAGEVLLEGLKRFAEYLEDGGDIKEYDKKAILASP